MSAQDRFDEANRRMEELEARFKASGHTQESAYFRAHPEERRELQAIIRLRSSAHMDIVTDPGEEQ